MTTPVEPIVATACGKVILLGEHAVVYGIPALCGALEHGATATAVSGRGALRVPAWNVETPAAAELLRPDFPSSSSSLTTAYQALLRSLAGAHDLSRMGTDFEIRFAIPTGAGLGSSAAMSVALLRAIGRALALPLSDADIDSAALAAEKVFHGHPSGLDHTVAQRGGFGLFRRGHGLEPIVGTPPLQLLIGHTGRARDTKGRVGRVAELHQADPAGTGACFRRIADLVEEAVAALRRSDAAALGAAMNQNQRELATLEVSCPEIEHMCELAMTAGALGCKLTGGGGGGCVVALAPGREAAVAMAWQAAGYTSFPVQIGGAQATTATKGS